MGALLLFFAEWAISHALGSGVVKAKDLRRLHGIKRHAPSARLVNFQVSLTQVNSRAPSGKTRKKTMIRKKWIAGKPVLSVETEDEFWKALKTGETVELTGELGEKIGLMEEDVGTEKEIDAARYDPSD